MFQTNYTVIIVTVIAFLVEAVTWYNGTKYIKFNLLQYIHDNMFTLHKLVDRTTSRTTSNSATNSTSKIFIRKYHNWHSPI